MASTANLTAITKTASEIGRNGIYRVTHNQTAGDLTIQLTLNNKSSASVADSNLEGSNVTVSGNPVTVVISDGQSFVDIDLTAIDDIQAEADETVD